MSALAGSSEIPQVYSDEKVLIAVMALERGFAHDRADLVLRNRDADRITYRVAQERWARE